MLSSEKNLKYKKKIPLTKKPIKIFKKIITVVIGGVPIPLLVEAKVIINILFVFHRRRGFKYFFFDFDNFEYLFT